MDRFPSASLWVAVLSAGLPCSIGGCSEATGDGAYSAPSDLGASHPAESDGDGESVPSGDAGARVHPVSVDGGSSAQDAGRADAGEPPTDTGPAQLADASLDESVTYPDRCTSIRYRIDSALSSAVSSADKSCSVDADCTATVTPASCDSPCPLTHLSVRGSALIATSARVIERDLCPMAEQYGCVQPPAVCDERPLVSRCLEGTCETNFVGCPDQVSELEGESCADRGKECWNRGWCPLGMACNDELHPGELRWEPIILACFVRAP